MEVEAKGREGRLVFHGGGCLGRLVCRSIICLGLGGYGGLLIWRDSATTTSASTRRYRKAAPCRTGSPARSQSVCLASWRHGPGTRGGLRARFCGAGGGVRFRDPFFDQKSGRGPPSQHYACRGGRRGFLVRRWLFFWPRFGAAFETPGFPAPASACGRWARCFTKAVAHRKASPGHVAQLMQR